MDKKKVLIYVEGGIVQDVMAEDIELIILDYDSLESGCCPRCDTELKWIIPLKYRIKNIFRKVKSFSTAKEVCPDCKIDWKNTGADEVYNMWIKGELE